MAFQKWVQDDFVQGGVFAPLLNIVKAIKLIFKHPNKSPFRYAKVEIDIKEAIVGHINISTEVIAHCEVTLINPTNNI